MQLSTQNLPERKLSFKETKRQHGLKNVKNINNLSDPAYKRPRYLTGLIMFMIIVAIIPVAIYEFCKGWIQYSFDQFKKYPSESFSGSQALN